MGTPSNDLNKAAAIVCPEFAAFLWYGNALMPISEVELLEAAEDNLIKMKGDGG
jgi:hypothetical protein